MVLLLILLEVEWPMIKWSVEVVQLNLLPLKGCLLIPGLKYFILLLFHSLPDDIRAAHRIFLPQIDDLQLILRWSLVNLLKYLKPEDLFNNNLSLIMTWGISYFFEQLINKFSSNGIHWLFCDKVRYLDRTRTSHPLFWRATLHKCSSSWSKTNNPRSQRAQKPIFGSNR